jgi:2-hydroxychromene-2-carboxylate isomerase
MHVELYFDLASPYAYLAVARAQQVFGAPPVLRPVLVGAIFQARGYGSWAHTPQRAPGEAEIEARAERYGLPPVRWPQGWPMNSLNAMRACVYADEHGALDAFVHAVYEREFAHGEDVSGIDALAAIAADVGLDALPEAVAADATKRRLRELTEAAWERGVRGVPTAAAGSTLVFGDDRLELIPR